MGRQNAALRTELHSEVAGVRADMASMHQELAKAILAQGTEMRALHEDLVQRIALLSEGQASD
jgi:hypothetical protein